MQNSEANWLMPEAGKGCALLEDFKPFIHRPVLSVDRTKGWGSLKPWKSV